MKILVGIQARTNSTRLPGKIYEEIFGKPMLVRVYENCMKGSFGRADVKVLGPKFDDPLVKFCQEKSIPLLQPDCSEDDLVARYWKAMDGYEGIVRITADCPMTDPKLVETAIKMLEEYDYVTNMLPFRTFPDGLDIQAAREGFMKFIHEHQVTEREHPFIYWENNLEHRRKHSHFKNGSLINPNNPACLKCSVDTAEDLDFVRKLVERTESKLVRP